MAVHVRPPGSHVIPLLLFALLTASLAAFFAIRARSKQTGRGRLDRPASRMLAAVAVALVAAAPFETTRGLLGLGLPAQCREQPAPREGIGEDADDNSPDDASEDHLRAPGLVPHDTRQVQFLTGPDSPDRTDLRWDVWGTDLGHPFVLGDRLGLVFGDTFGNAGRDRWRSNVMAWSTQGVGPGGITIDEMHSGASSQATEILGSAKLHGWEQTVIPTNSVGIGDLVVVHYMSVTCWGPPGEWAVSHSGLAVSRDGGRSFQRVDRARWPRGSGFAQVAFVLDQDVLYVFGIPQGRQGSARLARVRADRVLDESQWRYWDGADWSDDVEDAVAVVPGPVGELSVQWNDEFGQWVLLATDEPNRAIVLRTATDLQGPWSESQVVATAAEYPQLYAPYLLPNTSGDGRTYFTMSRYDVYNVLVMSTRLEPASEAADTP